jgi:CBS domain-containing protein
MDRAVVKVDAGAPLDEVYERMNRESIPVVAVYGGNGYLGLVSQEDIAEARLLAGYVQRQTEAQIRAT